MVAVRSRTIRKRKASAMTAAFKAGMRARTDSRPSRRTGGEMKFLDTTQAYTSMTTAGSFAGRSLNLIPDGTTDSERVGRKCTVKSVTVNGAYVMQTTATLAVGVNRGRFIIYQDKQANGGDITATTDILQTASVDAHRNLSNMGRFRILADKKVSLNATVALAAGTFEVIRPFSYTVRTNIPLEFGGTTGAITELRSNNIGILLIMEAAAPAIDVTYVARVKYTDL